MFESEKPGLARSTFRFSVTIALVLAAFLIRQLLVLHFGFELPTFILFYPAVMLSALLFGFWPGLLATTISAALAAYWFFPPIGRYRVERTSDIFALVLFSLIGWFMSVVFDRYRRNQRRVVALEHEKELRETSERLQEVSETNRLAVEAAELGAWNYRLDTGEVFWDEACRRGFGFPTGDRIVYESAINRIHPEDRLAVDDAVKQAIAGADGGAYHREYRVVWPDHSIHWIASHGRVYFEGQNGNRRAIRFIGVNSDITERKLAEEAVRESRAKLEAALESMTDAVFISDDQGQFLEFNDAFASFHKFASKAECTRAFAENPSFLEVFLNNGERAPVEMWAVSRALRGETVANAEYNLHRKDTGETWTGSYTFGPIHGQDGSIIGCVVTARDITQRKQAEEELRRHAELLDLAHDTIMVTDLDGTIRFWNHGAEEMYGYSREQAIGQKSTELLRTVSPLARGEILARILKEGRWEGELAHSTQDGTGIVVASRCVLRRDNDSRPTGIMEINNDITQRVRAEEEQSQTYQKLGESEARYRGLAESIPAMIWAADTQGMRIDQNRQWLDYTGQTHEQALGIGWRTAAHPDDLERVLERWVQSRRTGKDYLVEYRIRRASDGAYRWHRVHAKLQKDAQGTPICWFGTSVDIEDQKQAEEQLQKLNRTLRALSDSDQALLHATDEQSFLNEVCRIIIEDCGHRMVWIGSAENDEYKTVKPLAVAGHEAGYLNWARISWGDNANGRGPSGKAIRSGKPALCNNMFNDPAFAPWREEAIKRGYASSLVIPLKDGKEVWGAIGIYSSYPEAYSEGEVKLLTELADDLMFGMQTLRIRAAHAQAEALARNLLTSVQSEKERLSALVNSIRDEVWFADTEKRFTLSNSAARQEFGLSASTGDIGIEAFAENLEVLRADETPRPAKDAPPLRALRGEVIKDELELVRMHADGELRYREVSSAPVYDAAGKIVGSVSVVRDVTARKQAEQALLRSEKLASVGRMAAVVAHEINNPLAGITNLLYLAQGVENLPETVRQYLEMADAELKRIAHITQQSLGFYRESSAPAAVSVNSVLESALALMKSRIKAKHAVIEKQLDGEIDITAMGGELRQVFSNLLANSLDAIDEEGTIKLRVSGCHDFKRGQLSVRVTVADNGKGIAAASRPHIFEPFFTTKGTVGTGLGLWVAREIILKHHGVIQMHSCTNGTHRGTVFSVVLPVDPAKEPLQEFEQRSSQ